VSRVMNAQEFVAYANEQVAAIVDMLKRHRPSGPSCSCGRQAPCPVEESLRQRQQHFSERIALAEKTAQLPIVGLPSAQADPQIRLHRVRPRWRAALIAAIRRTT
jgi:hypothetical protein